MHRMAINLMLPKGATKIMRDFLWLFTFQLKMGKENLHKSFISNIMGSTKELKDIPN